MEAVEEHITSLPGTDIMKSNTLENENLAGAVAADLCHKSNGVAEIGEAGQPIASGNEPDAVPHAEMTKDLIIQAEITDSKETIEKDGESEKVICPNEIDKTAITEASSDAPPDVQDVSTIDDNEVVTEVVISHETDKSIYQETDIIKLNTTEPPSDDAPKFRTEIVIEANDTATDIKENMLTEADDTPNNLLSEFGESMELSDVLRSDITVTSENNNSSVRQEVFNKEELLDILEGNDVDTTSEPVTENNPLTLAASVETKLALQQLSRLKRQKRRFGLRVQPRTPKVKKDVKDEKEKPNCSEADEHILKKKSNQISSEKSVDSKVSNIEEKTNTEKKKQIPDQSSKMKESEETTGKAENSTKKKKTVKDVPAENIVNVLVMDWDDEDQEPSESEQSKDTAVSIGELSNETGQVMKNEEDIEEKPLVKSLNDSESNDEQAQKNKSVDENQPQRRLGRVIKKKVIFDPDNPDTFTKSKAKNRESVKDPTEKEPTPVKKGKLEHTPQRSKSKSPMSNLQWKKPSSKNSKQNKRLTEVDRLLMDEGAVNMIYQLTPEAPKGKKSRETKAEFIKKIQSSTPDGKEMKFRERKKEILKYEDGEAKKILGAKHRVSLNSSIKSPSVSEDFETHSADDSIIYRRHSSSSYSSSCMSPRRLSDVDSCSVQTSTRPSQLSSDNQGPGTPSVGNTEHVTEVFIPDNANKSNSEIINKDDYLSIKEKLNSKLSMALNKRKRESSKNEKPSKQKKVARNDEKNENLTKSLGEFKYVTIKINQRLAEICIEKIGLKYNIEVLKEVEQALAFVNSIKETSVTLLTSECGTLCSSLDVKHIIQENKAQRVNNAVEVAETIRSLLLAVDKHSKLLCVGVRARCAGVGLALAALADVVLAAESASFALASAGAPQPGVGALTARCRLPQSMVNDLVLFGRQLSASEALQGGLVSKLLWPNRFNEQVYTIAKDIAAEPVASVMLKKKLINLKKTEENEQTFLSYLDAERNIFVDYWTSVEGQELLRSAENDS